MAFEDYQVLGTWEIEDADFSEGKVTLKLKERKTRLLENVPVDIVTRAAYPSAKQEAVGKFLPLVYGKVYGVKPLEVDVANKRFKVAGHAIKGLIAVRIKGDDESWSAITPETIDLANGEFTLGADYNGGQKVVCDVEGRITVTGELMTNPADVVKDILEIVGETEINGASFVTARNQYLVGDDDRGREVNRFKPAMFIDVATKAQDVISKVNKFCASFLYINREGEWYFEAFTPKPLSSVTSSANTVDFLSPLELSVSVTEQYNRVVARYNTRKDEGWSEVVEETLASNQHHHAELDKLLDIDVPLWDRDDVVYWAQRFRSTDAQPTRTFDTAIPWQAFFLRPGEHVHVTDTYTGIDAVLEVLEVKHNLATSKIDLVFGNKRGRGDTFGFWTGEGTHTVHDDVIWDSAATDAEKLTARQEYSFWQGTNSMADDTDPASFQTGRWW